MGISDIYDEVDSMYFIFLIHSICSRFGILVPLIMWSNWCSRDKLTFLDSYSLLPSTVV
jgi:hypothetical protein